MTRHRTSIFVGVPWWLWIIALPILWIWLVLRFLGYFIGILLHWPKASVTDPRKAIIQATVAGVVVWAGIATYLLFAYPTGTWNNVGGVMLMLLVVGLLAFVVCVIKRAMEL